MNILSDKTQANDSQYPVITANEASREGWLTERPDLITTSANRHILQPTSDNRIRRESNIRETVEEVTKKTQRKHSKPSSSKTKSRSSSSKGKQKQKQLPNYKENENGEEGRAPVLKGMLRHHSSGSSSAKSDRSQVLTLFFSFFCKYLGYASLLMRN